MEKKGGGSGWPRLLGGLAVGFGGMTLFAGGGVLFGGSGTRSLAGQVVPFVLWFNFCAGFFYILAGIGLWRARRWSLWLAAAIALATLAVLAGFGLHVMGGGGYEPRTAWAMAFRAAFWIGVTLVGFRRLAGGAPQ